MKEKTKKKDMEIIRRQKPPAQPPQNKKNIKGPNGSQIQTKNLES
jgi:hypothetical protein